MYDVILEALKSAHECLSEILEDTDEDGEMVRNPLLTKLEHAMSLAQQGCNDA